MSTFWVEGALGKGVEAARSQLWWEAQVSRSPPGTGIVGGRLERDRRFTARASGPKLRSHDNTGVKVQYIWVFISHIFKYLKSVK